MEILLVRVYLVVWFFTWMKSCFQSTVGHFARFLLRFYWVRIIEVHLTCAGRVLRLHLFICLFGLNICRASNVVLRPHLHLYKLRKSDSIIDILPRWSITHLWELSQSIGCDHISLIVAQSLHVLSKWVHFCRKIIGFQKNLPLDSSRDIPCYLTNWSNWFWRIGSLKFWEDPVIVFTTGFFL